MMQKVNCEEDKINDMGDGRIDFYSYEFDDNYISLSDF